MNFILVPFLLAVRLPSDEDRWKNGPEYTFDARVSSISDLDMYNGEYPGISLLTKLKCRPKEPDRLRCRYENTRGTRLGAKEFEVEGTVPDENATYTDFGFGDSSFEIKFNEKGIESYSFVNDDRLMGDYLVNMYRLIANELNLGAELENLSSFNTTENSTVDECSAGYKVSRSEISNETGTVEFLLTSLNNASIDDDQATEITKRRYMDECLAHPVYFFGTRHTYGITPVDTIRTPRCSSRRMYISKSNFTSESINFIRVYDLNRKVIGTLLDHVRISLDSVDPATDNLTDIPNPITVGPKVDRYQNKCL